MSVKIPIVTVFDNKGLKQAQYQLKKVDGNVQNLKRNFALAGAAVAGFGLVIGKSVQSLARIEQINAQTEAVLKSMGQTAGVTSKDIQDLAGSLENLTATEAETIQEGANLLLTFRNVKNEAGAGNDIFNQTVTTMVDLARAMGTDASGEAIRLGKALNDPVKGISALTRVGVSFTQQQKDQIKALQDSGDIMGAQKIILAELQAQFGGSGAAFAQTFTGQLQLLGHELGTVGEEATMSIMPALQGMVEELRELIPVIGPQLKAAIESVDWKGLVTTLVDLVTWFVENARVIGIVVGAVWALNTAYNLGRVAIGLYNAAAVILNTTMQTATTSARILRTALLLGGVVVAVAAVVDEYKRAKDALEKAAPAATAFEKELYAVNSAGAKMHPWLKLLMDIINGIIGATGATKNYNTESSKTNSVGFSAHETNINRLERAWNNARDAKNRYGNSGAMWGGADSGITTPPSGRGVIPPTPTPTPTGAGSVGKQVQSITATLKKEAKIAKKEAKLLSAGLSEGLASKITGSATPIKTANKILKKIADTGGKAATKLQNQFNQTKAGQAELAQQAAQQQAMMDQMAAEAAAAAEQAARQAQEYADQIAEQQREAFEQAQEQARLVAEAAAEQARELQRIQEEAARAEEEALKERERIYNSFLDSVKNTFGQIKDSILNSFDLTQLGGSTDSIIRNMKKLLTTTRAFATNITKLSSMGLDPTLLAQVIQAGPVAGSKLAAALVSGGAAALNEINAGYQAYSGLAGDIATTGVNSRFNTAQQQTIYNINVNGGVGSGATIGKSIVDAIKAYERSSGAVWVGA
jgi:hypothetical protein